MAEKTNRGRKAEAHDPDREAGTGLGKRAEQQDLDAQPIADSTLRSLPEGHPGWNTPAVSQEFIRHPNEVDERPETDHRPDPESGIDPVEAAESFPSQTEVMAAKLDDTMIAGETREEVTGESVSPKEDDVPSGTLGDKQPDSTQPSQVNVGEGEQPVPTEGEVSSDTSREELYAKAQELDIPGRSGMSKDELAAAVAEAEAEA